MNISSTEITKLCELAFVDLYRLEQNYCND